MYRNILYILLHCIEYKDLRVRGSLCGLELPEDDINNNINRNQTILMKLMVFVPMFLLCSIVAMAVDVWDGTRATNPYASGSGTSGDPYLVRTAEQLAQLAYKVNSGTAYTGLYFKLMDDIDLDNRNWTPIGKSDKPFSGNFNGNGHSVTNLSVQTTTNKCAGLFGYAVGTSSSSVVIENVSVQGSLTTNESGYVYMGGICAYFASYGYTGGDSYPCEIKNCNSSVAIEKGTSSGCYMGGICGETYYYVRISGCNNSGNISGESSVGGICGEFHSSPNTSSTFQFSITNCTNTGCISGDSKVGGICGNFDAYCSSRSANSTYNISGCSNSGKIIGKSYWFGGVFGYIRHDVSWNSAGTGNIVGNITISNCENSGDIVSQTTNTYGTNCVGGICGKYDYQLYTNSSSYGVTGNVTINNCMNSGSISGGYCMGGIIGDFNHSNSNVCYNISSTVNIDCCSNIGDIIANGTGPVDSKMSGFVGGIFGRFSLSAAATASANWHLETLTANISHCYNSGKVSSPRCWVGGIVGYLQGTKTSDNKQMKVSLQYATNCGYVSSSYSGDAYIGGICGYHNSENSSTNSEVKYCLNSGVVKCPNGNYIGGICGTNLVGQNYVTYCLNAGDVKGSSNVAAINGSGACSNCYWDKQMCPTTYMYGTTTGASNAKLTSQLLGQSAMPSSSYFDSGTHLYPRPKNGSCSNSLAPSIQTVAATPIYLQETTPETVRNFMTCASVSTDNGVTWTHSNADVVSVDNATAKLSPNAPNSSSDITVSLNGASKIIDLATGSTVIPCCMVEIDAPSQVCSGTSMSLDAGVHDSYSWSDGTLVVGNEQVLTVSPTADVTYTVTINDSGCEATASAEVSVISCCTELTPPSIVNVTDVSDRSVTVSWTPPAGSNASSYTLYYGVNDPRSSTNVWTIENITSTSYEVHELTNGQEYNFAVMPVGTGEFCPVNNLSQTGHGTPVCNEY